MNKPFSNRKVSVAIPKEQDERPRYGHLGVIVAVCFATGVAWPFLAGVKLVPEAPVEAPSEPAADPSAQPAPAPPTPAANQAAAAPVSKEQRIEIEKSVVISCRSSDGKKPSRCDKPDLDKAVSARFQALASCQAAQGAEGTLSLGLKLDFEKNKVLDIVRGKSTTLSKETAEDVLACAKAEFQTAQLAGIDHAQQSYLVFYFLKLVPPGSLKAAAASAQAVVAASGSATVIFESAMVRDTADAAGKVLARLLYGTRVFVTGRLGDWYEVKYDSKGRKGFIHRNAIGMQPAE